MTTNGKLTNEQKRKLTTLGEKKKTMEKTKIIYKKANEQKSK